jgi:hypothetical protein
MKRTRWTALALTAIAAALLAPSQLQAADRQTNARSLPARVSNTTEGAERPSGGNVRITCAKADDVAWYRFAVARRGPVLVNVTAGGPLDAVFGVFRERRSGIRDMGCRLTDARGNAELAVWGKPHDTLVVGVGRRDGSAAGTFQLNVKQAEPPATPGGPPVPATGVSSSLDALLDADDAWSIDLAAGRPFRINLLSRTRNQCTRAALYPPDTLSFEQEYALGAVHGCTGKRNYLLFTPGPDGGGRYTLHVTAAPDVEGPQRYRLLAAAAATDDAAPGIELESGADVRGSLFGRGVDVVDLYSFSVPKRSIFRAELLTQAGVRFDLALIGRGGSVIGTGRSERPGSLLRFRELDTGLYYLAVRSRDRSGGRYQLKLSVREFTTTQMTIDGGSTAESEPGTAHALAAVVSPAGFAGTVRFQLDRFDPLSGWQFVGFLNAPVGGDGVASANWTPPSTGSWRVRARFTGTTAASVSQSGPVRLFVGPVGTAV